MFTLSSLQLTHIHEMTIPSKQQLELKYNSALITPLYIIVTIRVGFIAWKSMIVNDALL